jgi:hypothetical protein
MTQVIVPEESLDDPTDGGPNYANGDYDEDCRTLWVYRFGTCLLIGYDVALTIFDGAQRLLRNTPRCS